MSLPQGGGEGGQRSINCHYNFLSLPEGRGRGVEEVGSMSLYMEFFFVDGIPKAIVKISQLESQQTLRKFYSNESPIMKLDLELWFRTLYFVFNICAVETC